MKYSLDFRTFYNQFYISDKGASFDELNLSDQDYNDRFAVYENMIVVYPESYGHIRGELFLLEKENKDYDLSIYHHIVEGGINVDSGIIQLLSCPSSEIGLEIQVSPGQYRVRVFFLNLAGYDSDEEESNDHYKIEIWRDDNIDKKLIKNFPRLYPA